MSDNHWLDQLEAGVKAHIEEMQQKWDELVTQARPPEGLFDHVHPEDIHAGSKLNQTFVAMLKSKQRDVYRSTLDRARVAVVDYLSHFPPEKRPSVMLGALASVYRKEASTSDTAAWLGMIEDEGAFPWLRDLSPGQITIQGLRELGLLDDIIQTKEGLVVYPTALDSTARGD